MTQSKKPKLKKKNKKRLDLDSETGKYMHRVSQGVLRGYTCEEVVRKERWGKREEAMLWCGCSPSHGELWG